jgi:hypothetical protein
MKLCNRDNGDRNVDFAGRSGSGTEPVISSEVELCLSIECHAPGCRKGSRQTRRVSGSIKTAILSLVVSLAGGVSVGLSGCGEGKLETGYKYRRLGSTMTQRRAYYAGPFSPEAREAEMEQLMEGGPRRSGSSLENR